MYEVDVSILLAWGAVVQVWSWACVGAVPVSVNSAEACYLVAPSVKDAYLQFRYAIGGDLEMVVGFEFGCEGVRNPDQRVVVYYEVESYDAVASVDGSIVHHGFGGRFCIPKAVYPQEAVVVQGIVVRNVVGGI